MDASLKKMAKEIVKVTSKAGNSPQPYDTSGIVKRIEGGTAYVIFNGADEETPVSMTINCMPGDNVKIRVSDRKAWVTGNATAPPTDNRVAYRAINIAERATEEADIVYKKAIDGEFNGTNGKDGERGLDGEPAPKIVSIIQYWCFATARTIPSGGSFDDIKAAGYDWQPTIPEYVNNLYYWTKTITTYDDGETSETDPILDLSAQTNAEAAKIVVDAEDAADRAEDAADRAEGEASIATGRADEAWQKAQTAINGVNALGAHFWTDSAGAHVTESNGTINTGSAFNASPDAITLTQDGKLGVSLTGTNKDDMALNFYDLSGKTEENSYPMASFNNAGAVLYTERIRAMTLTSSALTFWDPTDTSHAGTSGQRKQAVFGSSSINFYANGNLASSFANSAVNFYDQRVSAKNSSYLLASYTRSGINLYTQSSDTNPANKNVRIASFTPSGLTFWDPSDTTGNGETTQRKEAIFGSDGVHLYGIIEDSGTYTNPEFASFTTNGVFLNQNSASVRWKPFSPTLMHQL